MKEKGCVRLGVPAGLAGPYQLQTSHKEHHLLLMWVLPPKGKKPWKDKLCSNLSAGGFTEMFRSGFRGWKLALFALRVDLYEPWPSGYVTLLFLCRRTVLLRGITLQKDTAKATQPSVGSSQERRWQPYLDWWGCGGITGLPCPSSARGQARGGIRGCLGLGEGELMVREEGHLHPPQTPLNRSVGGQRRSSARSLPLARGRESCPSLRLTAHDPPPFSSGAQRSSPDLPAHKLFPTEEELVPQSRFCAERCIGLGKLTRKSFVVSSGATQMESTGPSSVLPGD